MQLKMILFLYVLFALTGCSQHPGVNRPVQLYATTNSTQPVVYELGKVETGYSAEIVLNLKNTGQKPVVITNAVSFCGCTIPQYEAELVLPGHFACVRIGFKAEMPGLFSKAVRIYIDHHDHPVELKLTGEILPGKAFGKAPVQ